jgi:hypothetical protein
MISAALFGQGLAGMSGVWKMNAARSTPSGSSLKSLTVRIERHPKGEVFTLDRVETDGRTTSSSTILYLDGKPRRFEDFGCSGIQSSWRADERTVEIVRMCASGGWLRLLRRASAKSNELVLEIAGQSADGRRFDRRLTLERQ